MAKRTRVAKKSASRKTAKKVRGRRVVKAAPKRGTKAAARAASKKKKKKKIAKTRVAGTKAGKKVGASKGSAKAGAAKAGGKGDGKAATVEQYLAGLPADRRAALSAIRRVILDNLGDGYQEGMQYGMIGYCVPHSVYPAGYHCDPKQPLPFASIASQKNHMAVYLFCVYTDEGERARFEAAWKATGKKLDMGKACVRFKKLEDVPLEVIGEAVRRVPVRKFIEMYEAGEGRGGPVGESSKTAKRKSSK